MSQAEELFETEQEDTECKPPRERRASVRISDAVSSVNEYNMLRKKHQQHTEIARWYANRSIEDLLRIYHAIKPSKERTWLRDEIFFRTFFLLPHVMRQRYKVNNAVFQDAIQHMSIGILTAIELYDPERGSSFTNYLAGYFKRAIAMTFQDNNVVTVPPARRKALREMRKYLPPEEVPSYDSMYAYTGTSIHDDGGTVARKTVDFDEVLHHKQLKEWLEDVLSLEADILTTDERNLLIWHYGLFGHNRLTYREIAKIRKAEGKGHAFSRLSQIQKQALCKIREFFNDVDITDY